MGFCIVDKICNDEEVAGELHSLDHVEFVAETLFVRP